MGLRAEALEVQGLGVGHRTSGRVWVMSGFWAQSSGMGQGSKLVIVAGVLVGGADAAST